MLTGFEIEIQGNKISLMFFKCENRRKGKTMHAALLTFAQTTFSMMVSVKNITARLLLPLLLLTACGKKEKELTPAQINAFADSVVKSKMEKLRRQAREDLDRRLPIELKPKIDSIRKVSHDIGAPPVFPGDDGNPAAPDTGNVLQLPTRTPANDTQR